MAAQRAVVDVAAASARNATRASVSVCFGASAAETGGYGFGTGLSTGGGGASGYLDVGNFCCPDYLETMISRIQRNWESRQQVAIAEASLAAAKQSLARVEADQARSEAVLAQANAAQQTVGRIQAEVSALHAQLEQLQGSWQGS